MEEQLSVLVSTGNLGDNKIKKTSFYKGVEYKPDYLAADAGTADAGPTFLGADVPHNPVEWERHDLEIMLLASRKYKIPMIVGSCSTTGTKRGVDLYAEIIRGIVKQHKLRQFKMACIYSDISKDFLYERIEKETIEPLGMAKPLTQSDIDKTNHVTASMGIEQIIHALKNGADVVIAGRACDDAVIAAYPIFKGFPKGISLHMGKLLECASLVCWPQMVKESVLGTITKECFMVTPMHSDQRATPHSLAAHSMYERINPYIQKVPGGILDTRNCEYIPINQKTCKVTKSKYIPSPDGSYKVKLEGAGEVGYRVYHFVAIRDPFAIQNIDEILEDTKGRVKDIISPYIPEKDYFLYMHVYGRNGVMQTLEPNRIIKSHEIAILIEVVSKKKELATTIAKCAKFQLFYLNFPAQKNSSGGSVALVTDEPLYPKNKCYQWTIDHLLKLKDPLEVFRFKYEIVGE